MASDESGITALQTEVILLGLTFFIGLLFLAFLVFPRQPPSATFVILTNHRGPGDVLLVHFKGDGVPNAFEADKLLHHPNYGDLCENLKWRDLEVRVNGKIADNDLVQYALLPHGKRVEEGQSFKAGDMILLAFRQGKQPEVGDEVQVIHKPTAHIFRSGEFRNPPSGMPVDTCIQMALLKMLAEVDSLRIDVVLRNWDGAIATALKMRGVLENEVEPMIEQSEHLENDPTMLGALKGELERAYLPGDPGIIWGPQVIPDLFRILKCEEYIREKVIKTWDPTHLEARKVEERETARKILMENMINSLRLIENVVENGGIALGGPPPHYKVFKSMEDLTMLFSELEIIVPFNNVWTDLYFIQVFPHVESYQLPDKDRGKITVTLNIYNFGLVHFRVIWDSGQIWFDEENKWWVSKHFRKADDAENITVPKENRLLRKETLDTYGKAKAWGHQVSESVRWRIGELENEERYDWKGGTKLWECVFPHLDYYNVKAPYDGEGLEKARVTEDYNELVGVELDPGENRIIYYQSRHELDIKLLNDQIVLSQLDILCHGGVSGHEYDKEMVFWCAGRLMKRGKKVVLGDC